MPSRRRATTPGKSPSSTSSTARRSRAEVTRGARAWEPAPGWPRDSYCPYPSGNCQAANSGPDRYDSIPFIPAPARTCRTAWTDPELLRLASIRQQAGRGLGEGLGVTVSVSECGLLAVVRVGGRVGRGERWLWGVCAGTA